MNYDETFAKREKFIIKADAITEHYLELAIELLEKSSNFSNYSKITHADIDYDGVTFEYWIDCCEYRNGKSSYLVSKEVLDKNIVSFLRKNKLNKIKKYFEK